MCWRMCRRYLSTSKMKFSLFYKYKYNLTLYANKVANYSSLKRYIKETEKAYTEEEKEK